MSLVKLIFLAALVLILGNYLNLDFAQSIRENFINIHTDGSILSQVPGMEYNTTKNTGTGTLNALEHDLRSFAEGKFKKSDSSLEKIPYSTNDPTRCHRCFNLLPGSPGASQYNYGLSVDCGCEGVTGDLISGKAICPDCEKKCGVKYTFDKNADARKINFTKSTPEVINTGIQNSTPNHLISKIHLTEPHDYEVIPSNQAVMESPCDFKSEKTNLEQFFKANPDLFLPGDQNNPHKPFVPYTDAWKDSSDCFNNYKYQTDQTSPSHFIVNKVR